MGKITIYSPRPEISHSTQGKSHFSAFASIVLFMLLGIYLVIAFCNTPPAQSQIQTLDNCAGCRFSDVLRETIDCLSKEYDTLPDSALYEGGREYRMMEYLKLYGNCANETWDDRVKQVCLNSMFYASHLAKSEEDFVAFQKSLDSVGANPNESIVAKAIFFKDPSYCDAIPKEENRFAHFECRAFSSAAGISECSENFEEGDPSREECINEYSVFAAIRTKNITLCENITEIQKKLVCEALVTNSEISIDKMKKNYVNDSCMLTYAFSLAVIGVLDPDGLHNAADYCDTILDPITYKKCRELVVAALEMEGEPKSVVYCDKIPYRADHSRSSIDSKKCKDAVAESQASVMNRAEEYK